MTVAIDVQKLRVRSLDVDFHEVSWEIGSTTEDIFDYTFQLLRSEGPEGPYDVLTPEMEDRYLFIDNVISRGHNYREYYYKLRTKHKASQVTKDHGPVYNVAEPDLWAIEVRKHANILMREFAGRRCWVFPVRTFGQRCGCWSVTLGKRTRSGCVTCFDTGFVRGYMSPIEAWLQIDPNPKAEQNTSVGPIQQEVTTLRMGYWPPLKPRDLIVEGENVRHRANQISFTQKSRAVLHQEVAVYQIPKTDIEYKLEFDIGAALKDIWLSPSRNFTNPQCLETFKDEEIPDILSLYGSTYPPVRS
jgi:hypothetical protein